VSSESSFRPKKAYKNLQFLNSHEARSIRVQCELAEPEVRLEHEQIENTIVFFGSARTKAPADARQVLATVQDQLKGDESAEAKRKLAEAERDVKMAQYYQDAMELARRMTEWSLAIEDPIKRFIVCTGGGPGIMEAANRGAIQAKGLSIGMNISLPFEQSPNPYQTQELCFEFHYFFVRKFWLFYLARALIIFPGGFGTFDECFELLTLMQTEKTDRFLPIVLYGSEYWDEVLNLEAAVKWGTISPKDLHLLHRYDDVDSAFDFLTSELSRKFL
jgi:hypothetical protein